MYLIHQHPKGGSVVVAVTELWPERKIAKIIDCEVLNLPL